MESEAYEKILDSMTETGVCVVREPDLALLYFNRRVSALVPDARLGEPCPGLWDRLFGGGLPADALERGSARILRESPALGGTAGITVSKMPWGSGDSALVLTVTPLPEPRPAAEPPALEARMAAVLRSRFKMMNMVHLDTGVCERVTLSAGSQPCPIVTGDYESYISRALTGYVHPEDAAAFRDALSLEHLREKAKQVRDYAEEMCLYRQRGEPVRWIELHVIYTGGDGGAMVYILGQDVTREKNKEESSSRALEERAYIIGSLSSLFFATYYLDLKNDTFRTVTQQSRVGDVLGDEVNCTAALRIYANHFIHPDDREEYLRVMNVENMMERLRWWQPCVATEYRKLTDEPDTGRSTWNWVRATAVLARTGADDMPETAVYVAQEIGTTRREHLG